MPPTKTPATIEVNGYTVRAIRVLMGLSSPTVATRAGIDRAYLRHIENGTRIRLGPEKFAGLCRALGIEDRRALLANPHGSASEAVA